MPKKEELPSCPWCGGVRWVEDFVIERGEATIKEIHENDCEAVVRFGYITPTP